MRTSLVPSMLNMLAYNLNRGNDNVRLFEVGIYSRRRTESAGDETHLYRRDRQHGCGCGWADGLRGRRRVRSRFSI